jgi:hypothetical protein
VATGLEAIRDLSAWRATTDAARDQAVAALSEKLAGTLRLVGLCGEYRLPALIHSSTGIEFVVVPGGEFWAGMDDPARLFIMGAIPSWYRDGAERVLRRIPTHHLKHVETFACARLPLSLGFAESRIRNWDAAVRPHFGGRADLSPAALTRREIDRVFAGTSFRLIKGTEFEYLAKAGGRSEWIVEPESCMYCRELESFTVLGEVQADDGRTFGVAGLEVGEWVYEAEEDTIGARSGAGMVYPWEVGTEFMLCHAALRHTPRLDWTVWCARCVIDLGL